MPEVVDASQAEALPALRRVPLIRAGLVWGAGQACHRP